MAPPKTNVATMIMSPYKAKEALVVWFYEHTQL